MEQTECTSFEEVINRLLRKIEKDRDFFSYYNLSVSEVKSIVKKQATGYLIDAIDLLVSKCEPEVDFYDYDLDTEEFNFELTQREIGLLASLMYQIYFERDEALLKAFKVRMTPSDLSTFSPAAERNSFENMLEKIRLKNLNDISRYVSTDRESGKRKKINYSEYNV